MPQPYRQWQPRSRRSRFDSDEDQNLDPQAMHAMAMLTSVMFCPQCELPGDLHPGETCAYCGYRLPRSKGDHS